MAGNAVSGEINSAAGEKLQLGTSAFEDDEAEVPRFQILCFSPWNFNMLQFTPRVEKFQNFTNKTFSFIFQKYFLINYFNFKNSF